MTGSETYRQPEELWRTTGMIVSLPAFPQKDVVATPRTTPTDIIASWMPTVLRLKICCFCPFCRLAKRSARKRLTHRAWSSRRLSAWPSAKKPPATKGRRFGKNCSLGLLAISFRRKHSSIEAAHFRPSFLGQFFFARGIREGRLAVLAGGYLGQVVPRF